MTKGTSRLIEELKSILIGKFPSFQGIYFFGSRMGNTASETSDYDFALIFDKEVNWKFKDDVTAYIYNFMVENDIVIDFHIYSVKDFSKLNTPFKMNISKGIYYGV